MEIEVTQMLWFGSLFKRCFYWLQSGGLQSWEAPTHAKAARMPAELCGVLSEAHCGSAQASRSRCPMWSPITKPVHGGLAFPFPSDIFNSVGCHLSRGSCGKELGGFPSMPDAHGLLSSAWTHG